MRLLMKQNNTKSHAASRTVQTISNNMAKLTPAVELWRTSGHFEDFEGNQIYSYYRDQAGVKDVPLVVLLHGFPTCSFDWHRVISRINQSYPILTFDFLGFGFSDKPFNHHYLLTFQADLALELIRRHNKSDKIFIVAHDMGTSVCAEILARELDGVLSSDLNLLGALLFNGNMDMEQASLTLGQKILRTRFGGIFASLSFKSIFDWQYGGVMTRTESNVTECDDQWSLLCYNSGNKLLHKTIEYTFERVEKADRLLGAVKKSKLPLTFAWGMADPVATAKFQLTSWRKLRPSAPVIEFSDLGHCPHVEDPSRFANMLLSILEKTSNCS